MSAVKVTPYPNGVDKTLLTDPADMPRDPVEIGDDTLISVQVWARLQGVKPGTVFRNKTKSDQRRGTPDARPGDMPAAEQRVGQSPLWRMGTYREWVRTRPGRGHGDGRSRTKQPKTPKTARLPIGCPNCGHEITGEEVAQRQERQRELQGSDISESKKAELA